MPDVVEELSVVHKPVTVKEEHDWSVFHNRENGVTQWVVHSWWLSVVVGNLDSLGKSLVENDDGGHKEHNWHTKSVQHGQEGDVEGVGINEVNWHIFSEVNGFVGLNGPLSGDEWVTFAFLVNTLLQFTNDWFLDDIDIWHESLDEECSDDLETDIHVPLRHVVREWTIEYLPELLRVELLHIGIYNQNNESGIEELTKESTFYDGTFLLRDSIFTDPAYKFDDAKFKDCIDDNNDNCNR